MKLCSHAVEYFSTYFTPLQKIPKLKIISALVTGVFAYEGLFSFSKKLQHYLINKKIELPPTQLELKELESIARPKSYLGRLLAISLIFLSVVHIPLSQTKVTYQTHPVEPHQIFWSIFEFTLLHSQPLFVAFNSEGKLNLARSARYYFHIAGQALALQAVHQLSNDSKIEGLTHAAYNACALIDLFVFKRTLISS